MPINNGIVPNRFSLTCSHLGGFHQMSYLAYGDPTSHKVLICVHGLTRNALDFDFLAKYLAKDYYVICPDILGRGASDRLVDPKQYIIPQYVHDINCLIASLNIQNSSRQLNYLGTSMGALIGMFLAGQNYGSGKCLINKFIINDVGPIIEAKALNRIGSYLGYPFQWGNLEEAEKDLRVHYAPFGDLNDETWKTLTKNSLQEQSNGKFVPNYDPAIAIPFQQTDISSDSDLWSLYQNINCPILVIRGENSDILRRGVWQEMQIKNPLTQLLEIKNTGHAPSLMVDDQVMAISQFLSESLS